MQRANRAADDALGQRLIFFRRKQAQCQIYVLARVHFGFADGIPQRAPEQSTLKNVIDASEARQHSLTALLIQKKPAVSVVLMIGKDVIRAAGVDNRSRFG